MRAQGNQAERIKKTQLHITATCNAVVLLQIWDWIPSTMLPNLNRIRGQQGNTIRAGLSLFSFKIKINTQCLLSISPYGPVISKSIPLWSNKFIIHTQIYITQTWQKHIKLKLAFNPFLCLAWELSTDGKNWVTVCMILFLTFITYRNFKLITRHLAQGNKLFLM